MGALLLLLALSAQPLAPRVLILPSVTLTVLERGKPLDAIRVRAFSESFGEAARAMFEHRRFQVVALEDARAAIAARGQGDVCRNTACVDEVAAAVEASLWVSTVVILATDRDCRARVTLHDLEARRTLRVFEDDIAPCSAENVLGRASDLGRRIAEGPQLAPLPDLSLTPLHIQGVDLPSIPDLLPVETTSASADRSAETLASALATYRERRLIVVDGERSYVIRGERFLDDCEVFRAAGREVSGRMREDCHGNWWELAWAGLPLGATLVLAGPDGILQSRPSALPIFTGVVIAIVGPVLALTLNKDAASPEKGEHVVPFHQLSEAAEAANAALRRSLGLTEADVAISGLAGPPE